MDKEDVVVVKILEYCTDIKTTTLRFGQEKNKLVNDKDYFNSICMSLMQIGELSNHLSDEVKLSISNTIPWKSIRGLRNVFAHNYGVVDPDIIWETIIEDIPTLEAACQKWLKSIE